VVWHYTEKQVSKEANKITGAKAGGPPRLPVLAHWAARIAQFRRRLTRATIPHVMVPKSRIWPLERHTRYSGTVWFVGFQTEGIGTFIATRVQSDFLALCGTTPPSRQNSAAEKGA